MTQQIINIGGAIADGTGEPARNAFDKCNLNFTELYQVSRPTGNAIEFQFNNTITEPPSVGQIRFNQATQASTTKLWASHTTSSGVNIKQFLAAATTGAKLVLQDKIDNTNYIKFDVTGAPVDKTTYWEFTVAVTASGGNLPNAAILAAVTAAAGTGFITQVVVQKFTASGTYTPTAGMKYCIIECIGGGGGGGGVTGSGSMFLAAGGGGSGAYSRKHATAADIGASKTVTVGAAGGVGGDSSVGSLCLAKGGGVGGDVSSAAQPAAGAGGSGASGIGDITASGAPGGMGMFNNLNNSIDSAAGYGGSSIWGGGGRGVFGGATAATNYGSGGSGACVNVASVIGGGAGSAGIVIITEFI